MEDYAKAIEFLKEAMKVEMNELILINIRLKKKCEDKKRYTKKYCKGLKMLNRIFINLAMCK